MPWLQLRIQTNSESAETLSTFLNLLGAVAITMQDAADQPILEPALNTTPLWAETQILALFPEKTDIDKIINFLRRQINAETPFNYHTELLEEQNWERAWLDHFHPMSFGKRLWICPSTQTPPEPNAINIILDPGLAFGTGTHPTTALCLEWLDQNTIENKTVIDYGCGSGILAIAALKLGAKEAWAVDYDPQALEATLENAKRNNIELSKLHIKSPEQFSTVSSNSTIKTNILLANILANPLIELAPHFAQLLKPNGHLVLSGILENQIEMITTAYQTQFKIQPVTIKDGWVRIDGVKYK